jgi:hypothetical protein
MGEVEGWLEKHLSDESSFSVPVGRLGGSATYYHLFTAAVATCRQL